jgi:ABC-type multidrug transport system, ATPase and permease components
VKEKVTLSEFFRTEWKVLCDLLRQHRVQTIAILLLYNVSVAVSFTELKFVEFITDESAAVISMQANGIKLIYGSLLFLGTLLFLKLLDNVFFLVSEKYDDNVNARIKDQLTKKLSTISYEYFERKNTYEKISIAGRAVDTYTSAVYGAMKIIRTVSLLVIYSILLAGIGSLFTIMLITAVFICAFLCGKVSDYQLAYWRKHVHPKTRRNNYFKGIFGSRINQQNIQTQDSYIYFAKSFNNYNRAERRSYLKLNLLTEITEITGNLLFMAAFFFVAVVLGAKVIRGECEIGYFTMIIALLGSMFEYIKSFSLFLLNNNEFIQVVSCYYEVMEFEENGEAIEKLPDSSEKHAAILAENLHYQYPQAQTSALNGVGLNITKGEKIAIVGENGCGKTTLMSIIMGLLTSYQGNCKIADVECAAVLQDFIEYELTIRENIELGCGGQELPYERIGEILRQVNLYEYVMGLEQGFDTKLGQLDNGIELSKGQWQRLAVGRLLANEKADLWILDEPAAYLDPLAEIDVYKLIFSLAGERTVLFTSHRLGFARFADRILVMDSGKIIEAGTHQELMRLNGFYAQMFAIQRKWYQ